MVRNESTGQHFAGRRITLRRMVLTVLSAGALLAAIAGFAGVSRPAAAVPPPTSAGCAEVNKAANDAKYSTASAANLEFWEHEVVTVHYAPPDPNAGANLSIDGSVVDSSAKDSDTLVGVITSTGIHTVNWGSPANVTWHVSCAQGIDACANLNNPIFDNKYSEKGFGFPMYFDAGDTATFKAVASGLNKVFYIDDHGSTGLNGSTVITLVIPYAFDTAESLISWGALPINSNTSWTVSCTKRADAACADGAPVPAGYKLTVGTSGPDNITTGSGNDLVRAGDGDDRISDISGNDILCGQGGNDTINAGGGNDSLVGGTGFDTLNGGSGTDGWCDTANPTLISVENDFCGSFTPEPPLI